MASKRVKKNSTGMIESSIDIISQLPDSLIHQIFSFLPTIYLVRMSLVSKRWRHMWVSSPFLYFEDLNNITFNKRKRNRDMVLNFVTKYLIHRQLFMQIPYTFIVSFRFVTLYNIRSSKIAIRQIDDWLSFAIHSEVKELDLCVNFYCLPCFVLNASSLTILKLRELKLVASSPSTLPSLKILSLAGVKLKSNAESLQNLVSGCPIIEEMHLSRCDLQHLDSTAVSGTIRNLSLSNVVLNDRWLGCLISRLPLLERLTLEWSVLKNISIHSHSLKYFFLKSNYSIEATLTTPNLVWLDFECVSQSIISVKAFNLLEANLKLRGFHTVETLIHLLSNLSFLKKLMLIIWKEEVFIIA